MKYSISDPVFLQYCRVDLLHAAMVGPAGTPYHDGLFFFDVKLPADYPATPPQVCW